MRQIILECAGVNYNNLEARVGKLSSQGGHAEDVSRGLDSCG